MTPIYLFDFLNSLPNELLWILFALINFCAITLIYKLFGKTGLFVWIAFGTVIANLQVVKYVDMLGYVATLGNIMYGTLYLVTDSLGEKYGHKDAKKAVWLGFFSLISMVVIMQFALIFKPSDFDGAQDHLDFIFGLLPQIALGSIAAYLVSQFLDVYLFAKIKEKFNDDDQLWIRNIGSTVISQLVDTVIFVSIAFFGESFDIWFEILWTTYAIKLIVAVLDTPFVYWIKKIEPNE